MSEVRVASRYAKALLVTATQQKAEDKVYDDMSLIIKAVEQHKNIQQFLKNPTLKPSEKKKVLSAVFDTHISTISSDLLNLLVNNNRLSILSQVAKQFLNRYKKFKGIETAYVTSALPLSENQLALIKEKAVAFSNKKITLENKVDATIIGGFIIRIGDIEYNESIVTKLNQFKKEFTT